MQAEDVKALLENGLEAELIEVQGEGAKYHVTVVSTQFEGLLPVKKQQLVYGCLNAEIASGAIHAVTMSLFTPEQWASKS